MRCALQIAAQSLLVAGLALSTGCAASSNRSGGSWLHLPSPWATLKGAESQEASPPQGATASSAAKIKSVAPAGDEPNESLAMALLRGRNLERSGEWDKARRLYEDLRDHHPDSPQVAHRLGVVADAQRRHDEAEHYFLAALERDPRNAELLADLGYCYFLQGQLSKAESAATKSVALQPDNQRYRNNLGLALGHQGRYEEALAHFRKSGSEADAYYNLAFIYAAQDRVDQAKQSFQSALNADPTHRQARNALASFQAFDDRPEHLREADLVAEDDGNWVPFQEGPTTSGNLAQSAVAQASAVTSRDASRETRALHMEARGMLNRNMSGQRADEVASGN